MSTPEQQICEDYSLLKLSTRDLVEKYNLTKKQVLKILNKNEIAIEKHRRRFVPKLDENLLKVEYLEKGKSFRQIAEEYKTSPATVKKCCTFYGIQSRPKSVPGRVLPTKEDKLKLIGKIFGSLEVIGYKKGGWVCKCVCGNEKQYHTRRLTHDKVKTCGCKLGNKGKHSSNWQGYKNIPKATYTSFKNGAMDRLIKFEITMEEMNDILEQQQFKCALSGVDIYINSNNDRTASLDRIDSTKCYSKDNCQWVHKIVNDLKWNYSQEEFISWCKLISNNN